MPTPLQPTTGWPLVSWKLECHGMSGKMKWGHGKPGMSGKMNSGVMKNNLGKEIKILSTEFFSMLENVEIICF